MKDILFYLLIGVLFYYILSRFLEYYTLEQENFDPSLVPVSSIVTLAKVAQKLVTGGVLTNPGSLQIGTSNLNGAGNLLVTGNSTVNGKTTLNSTLDVTGNTKINGTLNAGATTLSSATVSGTLGAGATTLSSATVSGTLGAGATTLSSATVSGTLSAGATTLSSATVSGALNAGDTTLKSADVRGRLTSQVEIIDANEVSPKYNFATTDTDKMTAILKRFSKDDPDGTKRDFLLYDSNSFFVRYITAIKYTVKNASGTSVPQILLFRGYTGISGGSIDFYTSINSATTDVYRGML